MPDSGKIRGKASSTFLPDDEPTPRPRSANATFLPDDDEPTPRAPTRPLAPTPIAPLKPAPARGSAAATFMPDDDTPLPYRGAPPEDEKTDPDEIIPRRRRKG